MREFEQQGTLFGGQTDGAASPDGPGTSRQVRASGTEAGAPDRDGPEESMRPLAARMRPHTLDEIVGQEHLVGPGRALRRAIESDRVPSMILWGPPGSGKTTLAAVIAYATHARFVSLSAVESLSSLMIARLTPLPVSPDLVAPYALRSCCGR